MFYCFSQNNSGGYFKINDSVSHFVFIEADNHDQAHRRAIEWAGIYFDGASRGLDCPCCGDRWYETCDFDPEPIIYGKPAKEYSSDWTDYYIVYYEKDNGKPTKRYYCAMKGSK